MARTPYQGYVDPYAGSIRDILLRKGDISARSAENLAAINARATEASGQAWAGAIGSIGEIARGIPEQIAQQRQQKILDADRQSVISARDANTATQKAKLTAEQRDQALFEAAVKSSQTPTGDVDWRAVAKKVQPVNPTMAATIADDADKLATSLHHLGAAKDADAQKITDTIADIVAHAPDGPTALRRLGMLPQGTVDAETMAAAQQQFSDIFSRTDAETRANGTPKGSGFFGPLKRPDGRVSTEISVGVNIDGKEVEIPTLVPTLTEHEKKWLLTNDLSDPHRIPDSIIAKAEAHARERLKQGKSPFADESESAAWKQFQADALENSPAVKAKLAKETKDAADLEHTKAETDKLKNPPVPKKPDYTINGQRFSGDGTPIGKTVPPQKGANGTSPDGLGANALTPDAVDYVATAYRILGTAGIPTRLDETEKKRIINAATEQAKILGQSPAVAIQRQAAYKSDAKALDQMRKMSSSAESFENKALAQADLVRDLSAKVDRTQIPLINAALLSGKANFGDSNTQQLYNAITTFTSEYAKIMEGSTGSAAGSSDSARKASERLIAAKMNKGTVNDVLALMQKEMRYTINGYGATIDHITERMGGQPIEPTVDEEWVKDPKTGKLVKKGA